MLRRAVVRCRLWLFWIAMLWIRRSLRRVGYQRTARRLFACSPSPDPARQALRECRQIADQIERVSSGWLRPPGTCLHRSLVLWWYLRWSGLDTQVLTGAKRLETGAWDLHAWVVHHGALVNDVPERIAGFRLLPATLDPANIAAGGSS